MGRANKLSAEIYVEVDGKCIPCLRIDAEGNATWLVSDDVWRPLEQKMLKNIGENMSRFYTANPEYLFKENNNNEQKTA